METPHPSKVLQVHNVGQEITVSDLVQWVQPFGIVNDLVMLRAKKQALLEMFDVATAVNVLQHYGNVQPSVKGRNICIQFSPHQELTTAERDTQEEGDQNSQPNRILLVTIYDTVQLVKTETLHRVFSPYGIVEKIITFKEPTVTWAFIQYVSCQGAKQARNALQGRNIYASCCKLDIQFSRLNEFQVNDYSELSRDFTNLSLPYEQIGGSLQTGNVGDLLGGINGTNDKCTILVSNLNPDKIDEDKLFNLFSLYGDIIRIKLLCNKPDHALIEMGDRFQAELAVDFLKGVRLFGRRLKVDYSKHPNITPDSDVREYGRSWLSRLKGGRGKNYHEWCAPTKLIHISALPQDTTKEEVMNHLDDHGTIVSTDLIEVNGEMQALVMFENEEQAAEALVCKNASSVYGSVIWISFSRSI